MHRLEQLLDLRLAQSWHGGVGAHAAGVRPRVLVADPLEVLSGRQGYGVATVGDGEERDLLALQKLLHDEVASECGSSVQAGVELLLRPADEHSFPGCETVRLHHARGSRDRQSSSGRHAGRLEHLLGEALRPFDPRGGPGRAEYGDSRPAERVDQADHQGRLGADDDEIDAELAAQREQAFAVLRPDRVTLAEGCDARVPRRGVERLERRALAQLPCERVLASARPHDEHLHGARVYSRRRLALERLNRFSRPPPRGERIEGGRTCP